MIAGRDDSTGSLVKSGAILGQVLGPITVKGSIIGNETNLVFIAATGLTTPVTSDVAISKITVGGRVERAQILAGFDCNVNPPTPQQSDASIGPVSVGGDWIASSLVAGVDDGSDNQFGTADDILIAGGSPGFIASIAKVTIKGLVIGTGTAGDHFGFVAQQIGAFNAGGFAASLTNDTDAPIELSPITSDVTLREVS
jgi:hypothetical protein